MSRRRRVTSLKKAVRKSLVMIAGDHSIPPSPIDYHEVMLGVKLGVKIPRSMQRLAKCKTVSIAFPRNDDGNVDWLWGNPI
jgi:hypothetical protein